MVGVMMATSLLVIVVPKTVRSFHKPSYHPIKRGQTLTPSRVDRGLEEGPAHCIDIGSPPNAVRDLAWLYGTTLLCDSKFGHLQDYFVTLSPNHGVQSVHRSLLEVNDVGAHLVQEGTEVGGANDGPAEALQPVLALGASGVAAADISL